MTWLSSGMTEVKVGYSCMMMWNAEVGIPDIDRHLTFITFSCLNPVGYGLSDMLIESHAIPGVGIFIFFGSMYPFFSAHVWHSGMLTPG